MSDKNSDFAWNVHSYLNGYIKFGDTKAALICGLTGPLVFGLVGLKSWTLGLDVASGLGLGAIGLFSISFCASFLAIWPNLMTTKTQRVSELPSLKDAERKERPAKGFIYWKHILAHTNANTYAKEVEKLPAEEEVTHVGHHCHELAEIVDRKYWLIGVASKFFAAGLISLFAFWIFHAADASSSKKDVAPNQATQQSSTEPAAMPVTN